VADRDAKGRFIKGHRPFIGSNPGRKPKCTEEKYLRVFSETVKEEDLKEIILGVMSRARAQDMVAARIIFDYTLGKPAQQLTVDVVSDLNIALAWADGDAEPDAAAVT